MTEDICSQGHVIDNGATKCARCNSPKIGEAAVAPVIEEVVAPVEAEVEVPEEVPEEKVVEEVVEETEEAEEEAVLDESALG